MLRTLLAVIAALSFFSPALAQNTDGKYPLNSPYAAWFNAQVDGNGRSCCETSDGHRYDGDYTLNADGSVDLNINGSPLHMDAFKVLTGAEPVGLNAPILWYSGTDPSPLNTYCFQIGPQT